MHEVSRVSEHGGLRTGCGEGQGSGGGLLLLLFTKIIERRLLSDVNHLIIFRESKRFILDFYFYFYSTFYS